MQVCNKWKELLSYNLSSYGELSSGVKSTQFLSDIEVEVFQKPVLLSSAKPNVRQSQGM